MRAATAMTRPPPGYRRRVRAGTSTRGGCRVRKQEVGRFPTRERAEWRAKELIEESERNPRGYVRYLVRPVTEGRKDGQAVGPQGNGNPR